MDSNILEKRIIVSALRYLVKGQDSETGDWVIGFPYMLVKQEDGKLFTADCILELSFDFTASEDIPLPDRYALGIPHKEFHFVKNLFRFSYIDNRGIAHFEDETFGGTRN